MERHVADLPTSMPLRTHFSAESVEGLVTVQSEACGSQKATSVNRLVP
jgi:hypothetical protein